MKTCAHVFLMIALTALIFLTACGGPTSAPAVAEVQETPPEPSAAAAPADNSALLERWTAQANDPQSHLHPEEAIEITKELAMQGPQALLPIFGVLDNPDAPATAKVLAVICLSPYVTSEQAPRLIQLTETEFSPATRGCAIHLLGTIGTPEALDRIRVLMRDEDEYVCMVATLALLRKSDDAATARALELWKNPASSTSIRSEIVLAFPESSALDHMDLFQEALCMRDLDGKARQHAMLLVGNFGTQEDIARVEACLADETDVALRGALETALASLRKIHATAPAEPQTTPDSPAQADAAPDAANAPAQ